MPEMKVFIVETMLVRIMMIMVSGEAIIAESARIFNTRSSNVCLTKFKRTSSPSLLSLSLSLSLLSLGLSLVTLLIETIHGYPRLKQRQRYRRRRMEKSGIIASVKTILMLHIPIHICEIINPLNLKPESATGLEIAT